MQAANSRDCCRGSFPLPPLTVTLALFSTPLLPLQVLGRLQGTETLGSVEVRGLKQDEQWGRMECGSVCRRRASHDNTQECYPRCPSTCEEPHGASLQFHTWVVTVQQYGADMVRIRPPKTMLGIEIEQYWKGLE